MRQSFRTSESDSLLAYDFDLPPGLIAQQPPARRGDSRLLVLDRHSGTWEHRQFREITAYIRKGDLLLLNDTRVFRARLRAHRETGRKIEILLLEPGPGNSEWLALARPARAMKPGVTVLLEAPDEQATVTVDTLRREGEKVVLAFHQHGKRLAPSDVHALCERIGETPLPPYIRREVEDPTDRERYQTVYARHVGAVAAPTAGLHFSSTTLEEVQRAGGRTARVTLHVGLGTFQPLSEETLARSTLHAEWVEVGVETAQEIARARKGPGRLIAVGTTTVRAVESFLPHGEAPFRQRTEIFIKPGYTFLGVDALLTNFHLPRSSLLVLVSSFAGRELILEAYQEAIREGYRFYSYGDAMLIL